MLSTTVLGTIGSLFVGGAVAAVTIVGLVNSQTGPSGASPADVNQPAVVQYGNN